MGEVTIALKRMGDNFRVEIKDNGAGIQRLQKAVHPILFERWQV